MALKIQTWQKLSTGDKQRSTSGMALQLLLTETDKFRQCCLNNVILVQILGTMALRKPWLLATHTFVTNIYQ
jgi:hypothetical protein